MTAPSKGTTILYASRLIGVEIPNGVPSEWRNAPLKASWIGCEQVKITIEPCSNAKPSIDFDTPIGWPD